MKYYLSLFVLLLSACASLPPLPPMPASQINSWQINGRIAVKTESNNWTANVYWHQQDSVYQLRLNIPPGQGVVLLEGNANEVIMHTSNNETFSAQDPDTLIADVLKVHIPISDLNFWIRGIPTDEPVPAWYTFNEAGNLQSLRQNGWEIVYKQYINIQGIDLPKKIFLENAKFRVKIAVSQWKINDMIF